MHLRTFSGLRDGRFNSDLYFSVVVTVVWGNSSGKKRNLEEIIDGMEMVAEGVKTTKRCIIGHEKILLKCPLLQLYTKCFSKE